MKYSLSFLSLTLTILGCGPATQTPCETEVHGCSQSLAGFQIDPTCELEGPLTVQLGDGETSFVPLNAGDWLGVHSGAQGGHHSWVSLKIAGADLQRYDLLKVVITITYGDQLAGQRNLLLGKAVPLALTEDGLIEANGIVVFIGGGPPDGVSAKVDVTVTDPCARVATAAHETKP